MPTIAGAAGIGALGGWLWDKSQGGLIGSANAAGSKTGLTINVPPQDVKIEATPVTLVLDGQKVGEGMIRYIAKQGAGPVEGAPYHDATPCLRRPISHCRSDAAASGRNGWVRS